MNDSSPHSRNTLEKIKSILDEMKEKGDFYGLALLNQEGNPIIDNVEQDFDRDIFAAMNASVMKCAEDLGKVIGDRKVCKIITELHDKMIIIVRCGEEKLLIIFFKKHSINGYIIDELHDYVQKISEISQ